MKKITVIGLLCFLFEFTCQGQNLYSQHKNLEQASVEELNTYLIKAKKLKKTGAILSIGGPITSIVGYALFSSAWSGNFGGSFTAGAGIIMLIVGIPVTVIGLPILIIGSSRVGRINSIIDNASNKVLIEIAPCHFHNYMAQNSQAGIKFMIRF